MRTGLSWCLFGLVVLGGCKEDFEPPDRAARVDRASQRYVPAMFDTITWEDEQVRLLQGNIVYAERCRRCHGAFGLGETEYARQRAMSVPSLVDEAWALAELDSLRRKLYVGHEVGMPTFGDGALSLRQIDATAGYILFTLRPDAAERR